MHYAAKNNATASLKSLLNFGSLINARDYKLRTPLFVAAETGKLFLVRGIAKSQGGAATLIIKIWCPRGLQICNKFDTLEGSLEIASATAFSYIEWPFVSFSKGVSRKFRGCGQTPLLAPLTLASNLFYLTRIQH